MKRAISVLALLMFVAGIGLFAYLGIYNRYWADDWCYNADLRELGFVGTLEGYTYITTYASNRYSLTLFSGLFYALGIPGVQLMSALNIVLLCGGLYALLNNVSQIARLSISKRALAVLALMTVYYSLYLAPHLYQSVYWRSGALPYFEPLVMGVLVLALITSEGRQAGSGRWVAGAVAVLSFLAGGFSEAACATLLTVFLLFVVLMLAFRPRTWARRMLAPGVAALAGAILALIILVISPTSEQRMGLYGEPATLFELPFFVLRFSFDFVKYSFLDLPLPHLAILSSAFLLGYLLTGTQGQPLPGKQIVFILIAIAVVAFLLIAASYAPSAYIERAPPHPRTRILPRFVLTLAISLLAWILGSWMQHLDRAKRLYYAAALLFLFVALYTVRSIVLTSQKIPVYAGRAAAWDTRAQQIEADKAAGQTQIFVSAIDGAPVGGIRDFEQRGQGKPGYWINRCAARYYGVEAIDIDSP